MRRPKKPLRAPFVITAAAALVACNGLTAESANPTPDGPITNPPRQITKCGDDIHAGDACAEGSSCGDCCSGEPSFSCESGKWEQMGCGCNPPPPACPPTAPATGTSCNDDGATCSYGDTCKLSAGGVREYQCSAGVWKALPPGYTTSCPAVQPAQGESCAGCADTLPATCSYKSSSPDCPPVDAVCDPKSGVWMVSVSTCNPPPVDAGSD